MRRLGLVVAGLIVGVLLVEWLLGGPLRPPVVAERDAAWRAQTLALHTTLYEPDPELGYRPRPDVAVQMDYGVARHDRWGFRGEGVELVASAPRIAMLGDSLVWGELLAEEDTLPRRLEGELGLEVLNAGVSGFDTVQEVAWYERRVRAFEPDLVVLVVCLNDLLTMSGPLQVHGGAERLAAYEEEQAWLEQQAPFRNETVSQLWFDARSGEGSQVLAALDHAWSWHRLFSLPGGYVDEPLLSLRDPARVAAFREAVGRLGQVLAEDGTPGVLVVSPGLYWWHRYPWDAVHELARSAGEAAGLLVLDPLPDWRGGSPEGWRFEGDNLHYNARGSSAFAGWLAGELRDSGSLPGSAAAAAASGPPAR